MDNNFSGTLAVDLGNTNTVIAFQDEKEINTILIEIPLVTSSPGVIPTAIWFEGDSEQIKIGESALRMKNAQNSERFFHSNFKRLIGNNLEKKNNTFLSPNQCGEKFFKAL